MKRFLILFVIAVACGAPAFKALAIQDQDSDVRGAFLTSRPKASEKSNSPKPQHANRRRPKPINPPATNSPTPTPVVDKTPDKSPDKTPKKPADTANNRPRQQKLGVGVTLFMRDSNGLSVRVDPSREFHRNERVRLLLETNADGFLYVFNTTDGGEPVMIYPDPELDDAGNYIQAHVPVELPSSLATEERLKWFRFDENPGAERLYLVFSREPLSGIPLEDELIAFCKESKANCPMRPAKDLWAQVQKQFNEPISGNKATAFGGTQTENEKEASTRGIGLNREDPEPSLIMMSASGNSNMLVTAIELLHK
jgi:hypothetical protein